MHTYRQVHTYVPFIASHRSVFTEGTMRTHSQPPTTPQTVDRRMLGVLKKKGAQSMDGLSTLTGIGWEQVFTSVDRLSRMGKVSITPIRPFEYRISLGRTGSSLALSGSREKDFEKKSGASTALA